MRNSEKKTLEKYRLHRKEIEEIMDQIEKSVTGYYNSIIEQIKLKNCDPQLEIKNAYDCIYDCEAKEQFKSAIKKLISMIPAKDEEIFDLSES